MDIQKMVIEVKKKYNLQQVSSEWVEFLEYIRDHESKIIMDIGTASGASTLCLSNFADCMISVDPQKPSINALEEIKSNCKHHFIKMKSGDHKCKDQVARILKRRKIDVLFIDGDHRCKGAKRDFTMFLPLVRNGGIIAFHDIKESAQHRKAGCTVYIFWNEIKDKYKSFEITHDNKWGGIGVITK